MATQRRTARRLVVNGTAPRRGTAWDDQMLDVLLTNGSQEEFQLLPAVTDPQKRGYTLVRMLFNMTFTAAVPGAVSGQMHTDIGIALVSADAFVAGAVPDPSTDSDFPVSGWLFRHRCLIWDETLATGIVPIHMVKEDLRAMRKLDRSFLTLILETSGVEGTTFTVRAHGLIRSLYKLP